MKAGEVMTTGAATVRPDASLAEAARILIEHRISGLPVVNASGKLVGIVTEHDFLRKENGSRPRWLDVLLTSTGHIAARELHDRRVEDVMSRSPVSVGVETSVKELLELMQQHRVKRIPVVSNDKIVGIVSRANLLLALTRIANRMSSE